MDKAKALKLLCAKLYEMERTMKRSYHCKLSVSGDRSELIRTYNFPQGRVMDRCQEMDALPHSVLVSDAGEEGLYPGPNFDHIFEWC
ncbi:hypothetical protein Patl1_19383 [Pistacia atlantica]|uniref:Uncharacterized protein n=1 Tax=Pistacia atlantica TaxID=434234 RepID=A0ACC1C087_9ROSI|nr:hypothetical protein Patl1_19383 [Pistacia atlantica]